MYTSDLGDHIGMESCVDLETDIEPSLSCSKVAMNRKPCETSNRRRTSCTRKELPPPLPIQTSTVMKRYYTNDKRLVITEEKAESPKFHFMARRSHGRLTLQLVNNNNNNNNINELCPDDDHENVNENVVNNDNDECGGGSNDEVVDGGGCGCYMYNTTVRVAATGPCLFLNQNQVLHAIRSLQI